MEYVLETRGIVKRFGSSTVLNGVDLHVRKGDIYGFIGKNGAGKTTLMKIVCGLSSPTAGSYTLFGMDNADEARKKIGSLIESPALMPYMTVKENLTYYAKLRNASPEKAEGLLTLVGLSPEVAGKKAGNMSLGMKQRLSIAIALLSDPDLLVLDEPINGLDPEGIVEVRQLLVKLNQERGITIFISSHILGELEKMVTRCGIIRDGKIMRELDSDELQGGASGRIVIETSDFEKACQVLQDNGITVTRSYNQGTDLEELFMDILED